MANSKELGQDTIAQIIALKEADHQTKEVSDYLGLARSTVWKWYACFYENRCTQTPAPQKTFRMP